MALGSWEGAAMGLAAAAEDAAEDLALATKAAAVSLPAGMLSPSSAITARCALPFPPPWDGNLHSGSPAQCPRAPQHALRLGLK